MADESTGWGADPAQGSLMLPVAELRPDTRRGARTGTTEAVYGPGKSPVQCAEAVEQLVLAGESPVLLTRATARQVDEALARCRDGVSSRIGTNEDGKETFLVTWSPRAARTACITIATGGTSDLPVAREVESTIAAYGYRPTLLADVGVAGIHRLLEHTELVEESDVVIVVAGMEGALPSVVSGLTRAPVIAVPTSTGYGSSLGGITALLAMLAGCSPGVAVVGIDNGFGAACAAVRVLAARGEVPA